MNEWKLKVITWSSRKARENECEQVTIGFVFFLIGWKSGASFLNQLCSVVDAKLINFRHSNEYCFKTGSHSNKIISNNNLGVSIYCWLGRGTRPRVLDWNVTLFVLLMCSSSAGDSVVAVKLVKSEKCNANLSQCFLIVTVFNNKAIQYFCFVSHFVFKSCCFCVLQLRAVQLHVEDIHFMQDYYQTVEWLQQITGRMSGWFSLT